MTTGAGVPGPGGSGGSARLAAASRAELSYDEVGATARELPAGYSHVRRREPLGRGLEVFERATTRLMTWQMHRGAGLKVEATSPRAEVGSVVVLGVGVGPLRLHSPCRVVLMVDVPLRQGFAYGTLRGHPVSGEELFVVSIDDAERVQLELGAFSRPATPLARLGGPVSRLVQARITNRYVAALTA